MVTLIFILIALFICVQIVYQRGYRKVIWLLGGIIFFPHSIAVTDQPFDMTFHRLFIYTLLVDTIITKSSIWPELKKMPAATALALVFIANLMTGIFDEGIGIFLKVYRPVTYFIENFLILFLAYVHINKAEEVISVYKKYIIFLFIFGLYGLSNYITKSNEYYNLLELYFGTSNFANANMYEYLSRFRVSSFAFHAILYGLLLCIGVLIFFFLYYYHFAKKLKVFSLVILLLLFVNLLLVNSRTPFICLIAGFSIFYLFALHWRAKFQIVLIGAVLFFTSGLFLEDYQETMLASIDVFSSREQQVVGSSLEMRKEQLDASYDLFQLSPLTGNGFQYTGEVLGYSANKTRNMAPEELRGVESYLFKLMIEQGLFAILANFYFFFSLLYFFYKKSKNIFSQKLSLLGFAMLVAFLLFIFGTGDLNSFPFFMILLGVTVKGVQLSSIPQARETELESVAN